jgi:hypothetical protein
MYNKEQALPPRLHSCTPSNGLSTLNGHHWHKSSPNHMASKFGHSAKIGLQHNGNNDEDKPLIDISNARR